MIGLVLAGGVGSRFWPVSRRLRPKQLLDLFGGAVSSRGASEEAAPEAGAAGENEENGEDAASASLLARTVRRIEPLCGAEGIWISTTEDLAPAVAAELPGLDRARILGEPVGRNTAPAIGWAVRSMPEAARRDVIAVFPSDHFVADEQAFRGALRSGVAAVERGDHEVVTVGVAPAWPETGYGYLELAAPAAAGCVERVARFVEKPDRMTAERFVDSGRHFWNAGIFLFRGAVLLELYERHLPDLAAGLERLAADPERRRALYGGLPSVSIDYGVMERLSTIGAVVADCGWNDLGSWASLAEALPADGDGNRTVGDALAVDARDNLLFADAGTVAAVGVEGLAIARTGDAVLVVPRERAQEVRRIVERLQALGRRDLL